MCVDLLRASRRGQTARTLAGGTHRHGTCAQAAGMPIAHMRRAARDADRTGRGTRAGGVWVTKTQYFKRPHMRAHALNNNTTHSLSMYRPRVACRKRPRTLLRGPSRARNRNTTLTRTSLKAPCPTQPSHTYSPPRLPNRTLSHAFYAQTPSTTSKTADRTSLNPCSAQNPR